MDEENQKGSPRFKEAKHAAVGLLKAAKIDAVPVVINQLIRSVCQLFDVTIKGVPSTLFNDKGDAMTQARGTRIFILYNDERSVVRKRFSVAHELGHLYLGHLHGHSSIDLNTENFDELEANSFAAHLLMPATILKNDIKAGMKPDELAKKYQVSSEAMWWHIQKTGLLKLL